MDPRENEFLHLLEQTERVFEREPKAEQAIAVKTAKGNVYSFANHNIMSGDNSDENRFIQMLADRDDTQVRYLVCKWNGHSVDITSWNFRYCLMELNMSNENAEMIAQGYDGYLVRRIKETMQPRVIKELRERNDT